MATMQAPHLWLNGRQITGLATDRAPVLCPVELNWGADSPNDQPSPANLKFTILFLDGMHDIPDLANGAKVELTHPVPHRTIFAGTIRTMNSQPSSVAPGALEVTANATDYIADLEGEFVSTDWPSGKNRRAQLIAAFDDAGWNITPPASSDQSSEAVYNSIKLVTLLDRHISRYRGKRYDVSRRNHNGYLVRSLDIFEGTKRVIPGDSLVVQPDKTWGRTYGTPTIGGIASPALVLPAENILSSSEWSQDPDNTITAVQLSLMEPGEDGLTTQFERNYKAAAETIEEFGLRSINVESDLLNSASWSRAAAAWMNNDSPWQMSDLIIRETKDLTTNNLVQLLDQTARYKVLATITGIMPNRPDPGTTVLRSFVLGGQYQWTGKKWEISLRLERTIYARPTQKIRFSDIAASSNADIATARQNTIGRVLTFADFQELEAPN